MGTELKDNIAWTKRLEVFFTDLGEKATCLSWCHKRAEELYAVRRTQIDLPVIILSSITGFLSVGSNQIFKGQNDEANIGLGILSLFVGIINTTGSYFGWAKRTEAHKISAVHYARLYRFLSIEMALPRDQRMNPKDLLKQSRDQQERLSEISPILPPKIIEQFKAKFGKVKDITFPEELNGLEPITVQNEQSEDLHDYFRLSTLVQGGHEIPLEEPIHRRGSVQELMTAKGTHVPLKDKFGAGVGLATAGTATTPTTGLAKNPLQPDEVIVQPDEVIVEASVLPNQI